MDDVHISQEVAISTTSLKRESVMLNADKQFVERLRQLKVSVQNEAHIYIKAL